MKTFKFLAIAAALVMIAACGPKGGNGAEGADSLAVKKEVKVKASSLLPTKARKDSVSYLLGYVFGGYIKGYNFGSELDDFNFSKIKAGINDVLRAKSKPGSPEFEAEFKISPKEIDKLFNDYLAKRFEYTKAKNLEDGQAYINKCLKKGYTKTESGLVYKVNNPGSERLITLKDTLEVNYKGTLVNGNVFDQSTPERGPLKTVLADGNLIKGWIEGLQLVGDGGSLSLVIPAELAYGERGRDAIEPNSTLIFDMEVVSVKPYAAPAVEEPVNE